MIGLGISQCRLNVPCLPEWILNVNYLDEFHMAYMSFVYLQHSHNNPVLITATQTLVDIVNKKKAKDALVAMKLDDVDKVQIDENNEVKKLDKEEEEKPKP